MTEFTGQTLGRYHLVERLGRGGMADVYKAYQPSLDRYVAIKVMHPHLADQTEFITRFEREAKAVAKLKHPNIIQVYDFDVQDDRYFMAMEYVEGSRTLKEVLADLQMESKYLPLSKILNIIAKVADALDYAHRQGMIHRDVKPSNILLPNLESPLLSDFGIAKLAGLNGLTATNMSIGTPAYMAPELGKGEPASEQTDIYALGIVLYECLMGTPPYDADTPYGVILKHINDPLIPPHNAIKNLPDDVERIILKSLAKNPQDRYANAAYMRDALKSTADHAERDKVELEYPPISPRLEKEAENRFEAPTVVEKEDAAPVTEVMKEGIDIAPLSEEKASLPGSDNLESVKEASSTFEENNKPRKKVKAWVWGVSFLGLIGLAVGIYFLIYYFRLREIRVIHPAQSGYEICPGYTFGNGDLNCESIKLTGTYTYGRASWSPDASQFVFSACLAEQTCGLFISDLAGNMKSLVMAGREMNAIDPAWSPDGKYVAFHGSGELYITDLSGKLSKLAIGTSNNCPFGIAWSPDSQWLAWIGGLCGVNRKYVYSINRNGTGYQENYYSPSPGLKDGKIAWAPDGKSIVIANELGLIYRIYVNCNVSKGCSTISQSTQKSFPLSWLTNHTPQWQLDR